MSSNDNGCNVVNSSVSDPSGVSEVILTMVSPSSSEGESSEVDGANLSESSQTKGLHALHGEAMVEVSDVDSVYGDLKRMLY